MIEREDVERIVKESVVARVVCDRCGKGKPEYEGAFVRGELYPSHNLNDAEAVSFDLCESCTRLLREWVASP